MNLAYFERMPLPDSFLPRFNVYAPIVHRMDTMDIYGDGHGRSSAAIREYEQLARSRSRIRPDRLLHLVT